MQRLKHQQDITDEHLEPILNALEATHDAVLLKHTAITGKAFDQEFELSDQKIDLEVEPAEKLSLKSTQSTQQAASSLRWSTWDQVKRNPATPAQQSNLSSLSWSTWAQLGSKIGTNLPTNIKRNEDDRSAS